MNNSGFISAEAMARLAAMRKEERVSFAAAANAAGCSAGHLHRAEHGLAKLTPAQAEKLEQFLATSIRSRLERIGKIVAN